MWLYFRGQSLPNNVLPSDPPGKINMFSIGEKNKVLAVNDVFHPKNSSEKPVSVVNDPVTKTTSALLVKTDQYETLAFSGTDGRSFLISILTDKVEEARGAAEEELLRRLGVSREIACGLPIRVVVSKLFYEELGLNGGEDIKLGFCPGSKHF